MIWALLLKYWHWAAIAGLVAFGGFAWHAHNTALLDKGRAEERARVADSTLKALKPQIARVDTQYVHDTKIQTRTIARVDTLRDSVLTHIHDTAFVVRYVAATDSALHACTEVANDCAEYKRLTALQIAALNAKLAIAPALVDRRRWYSDRLGIGVCGGVSFKGQGFAGVCGQVSIFRYP